MDEVDQQALDVGAVLAAAAGLVSVSHNVRRGVGHAPHSDCQALHTWIEVDRSVIR